MKLLAQGVEQVDTRDQADEPSRLGDDRDVIALEDRQQAVDRRVRPDRFDIAHHRGADGIVETRGLRLHMHEQIGFIKNADKLFVLHHRQL